MISRILSLLQSSVFVENDRGDSRFWARLIHVVGEEATLETADGSRFSARLTAKALAGEKLLLERGPSKEGIIHCRILERIPAEGEPVRHPAFSFAAVIYAGEKENIPYFLITEKENDYDCGPLQQTRWRFTLRTENIGVVVLLIERFSSNFMFSILAEDEKKAAILTSMVGADKEGRELPVCRIRAMSREERRLAGINGSILDGLR